MTRIALVTGSAQNIGRTIALQLARDGLDVAVNDLRTNEEALKSLVTEIEKLGRRCIYIIANVTEEKEVEEMVARVANELGGLDVVSVFLCGGIDSLRVIEGLTLS